MIYPIFGYSQTCPLQHTRGDSGVFCKIRVRNFSSGLLKANANGNVSNAIAGTDYQAPLTNPVTGTNTAGQVIVGAGGSAVTSSSAFTVSGGAAVLSTSLAVPVVKINSPTSDSIGPFNYGYKAKLSVLGGARIESATGESLFLNSRVYTVAHSDTTLYGNNVIALQNTAKTTANKRAFPAAARFLDSTGAEVGAIGWQPSTGSPTYELQETVFLASSMPYKPGQTSGIAPKRLALCQEGLYSGSTYARRRLEFNTDWSVNFRDPLGVNYLSFTDLGVATAVKGWTFSSTTTHAGVATFNANGVFNARVGIGTAPAGNTILHSAKGITGATFSYGHIMNDTVKSDVTGTAIYSNAIVNTQASSFTNTNTYCYRAEVGNIGAGSAITNLNGFFVSSTFTSGTNNYGFRGNIAAASGRYNTFNDGTAQNHFAGNVGIGASSTAPPTQLYINGALSANAWTTSGVGFRIGANTYTDLTSTGSPANVYIHHIGIPTFAATNAITPTQVYTLNIEPGANGSNVTAGAYNALRLGGTMLCSGSINMTGSGVFGKTDNNNLGIRTNGTVRVNILNTGLVGIGPTAPTPTSYLHLAAGTATANTAPEKNTSGTLLTVAEAGAKEYNNSFYQTKNSGLRYALGGTIFDAFADAGNTTTTETDLHTYTTPASILDANGGKIKAEYGGIFVSSGTATRQLKVYFAGTAIFDSGALSISTSASWNIKVFLVRVSSTVVRYTICLNTQGAALAAYTATGELTGLTLTNTNIIKVTGQAGGVGAATNDIVLKLATGDWQAVAAN